MLRGYLDRLTVHAIKGGQFCVKSDIEIQTIGTASIAGGTFNVNLFDGSETSTRALEKLAQEHV